MFSLGSRSISARTTVSPPTPESNTPMGRCVRLFGFMLLGLLLRENAYCTRAADKKKAT